MKFLTSVFAFLFVSILLSAQGNSVLKVNSYKLDNGFTVFLNEDPTAPKVFGAVMVNAGSKNEYPDATGMAHYLEHLLFKGTDVMSTTDFEKEKPYLDSIVYLYDQLAQATTTEKKLELQKSINAQALKASEYGLPNEFDKMLRSIGGKRINAFTNTDITFYHNSFPAHEINKWLDLYSARFQNPIFRSFQSELEVVYEEKNRGMDNFTWRIIEKFQSMIFPGHPYGQWTPIGKTEHLKNPQLSKMYAFFYKYYVPENMALILSGNFKSEEVIPLIKQKFGTWKPTGYKKTDLPTPTPLSGIVTEYVKYTPIKAALIGFQTVPQNHADRAAVNVCESLLFNESETGYLNKLQRNGDIMFCGALPIALTDAGCTVVFFVPKIFSQSYKSAESKVMGGFSYIKEGKFTDEELNAVKFNLIKQFEQELESVDSRGVMIGEAFNTGITWEEHLRYPEKIKNITREDVMAIANKYYGNNYARLISSTGFGKNEKLQKPTFKPVVTEQKGKSKYAEAFEKIPSMAFIPKFIQFKDDVTQVQMGSGHTIFAVKNPVNDLFYLEIKFKTGKYKTPSLETAVSFIDYCGAGQYDLNGLKNEFAKIGCTYSLYCEENYLVVGLQGNQNGFDKGLQLLQLILSDPKPGEKSKSLLVSGIQTDRKFEKRTPDFMGRAILEYAVSRQQSEYLQRETVKQIQATSEDKWIADFKYIIDNYATDILYTGNLSASDVQFKIKENLRLSSLAKEDEWIYKEGQPVTQNTIYFVNNKNAAQTHIYFYVPGEKTSYDEYADVTAFNEYFSGGFSGLMMQEIREYRSLAYATGGRYGMAAAEGKSGRLVTFIGCQADKTVEATELMVSLLKDMPLKEERMDDLKNALRVEVGTSYPEFKELAETVATYQRKGFKEDPNKMAFEKYNSFNSAVLMKFYESHVKGKPYAITIYGDKSRFDLEKLKALGQIIELKEKDFIVF